jgi:hypothetical protein
MIKCPECGVENTADSNYCRRCGSNLVAIREYAQPGERFARAEGAPGTGAAEALAGDDSVLQIRSPGDREGDFLPLQGEVVTIGRSPKSDLFLDDVTVSRHHARVLRADVGFTIEDEGSLNGTYVNRRRIESHQLFDGDEVQIGKFKLTFLEEKGEG